jgi:8-oxo-dGTP pyrophosphatase MutT (NUDIX family)
MIVLRLLRAEAGVPGGGVVDFEEVHDGARRLAAADAP